MLCFPLHTLKYDIHKCRCCYFIDQRAQEIHTFFEFEELHNGRFDKGFNNKVITLPQQCRVGRSAWNAETPRSRKKCLFSRE